MRPYEVMIIFDPPSEAAVIQGVLDRALEVVRDQRGATPGPSTAGGGAPSPTR